MRLDKYLTECGIGTRSEVKKILKQREVKINGQIVTDGSFKINLEEDFSEYKGKEIKYKQYRYYIMNKKAGYITALKDKREKTVMDLLPEDVVKKDLFPVGRLDKDTEGLLLFTNNGNFAHELSSPKYEIEKKYYAQLKEDIDENSIKKLEEGVFIEINAKDYKTKNAKVEKISEKEIFITITEGKFHQVKKMLSSVNNEVLYLKRVSFANLELNNMEIGEVIEISQNDIIL